MEFQKIEKNGVGIIHLDTTHGALAAGVIYLNQDIDRDTGTSFYKLTDPDYKIKQHEFLDPIARYHAGEHVDGLDNICEKHYNMFEETMRVQNQYNRLLFYSGDEWHTATSYDNQTRYTLRYFISELKSNHQNFPLLR